MIRLLPIISLLLVSILLMVPIWVLADTYQYGVPISVFNNGSAARGPIGVVIALNNVQLVELGYINAAGLNTNLVAGTANQPYSLTDGTVGVFINSISGYQTNSYNYRLGNFPGQTGFPIIVGAAGNITVSDSVDMELGDNFTLEVDGYIDTSIGSDKNLVYKGEAFRVYVSGAGNLTAGVYDNVTPSLESSTSDGYLWYSDGTYATCWNATSSESISTSGDTMAVGQSQGGGIKNVYRAFVYLPTGVIPDDVSIISARLALWGYSDNTDVNFDLTVQNGMPTYPSDPLVEASYNRTYYSGDGGSVTTSGWDENGWNNITLNAVGRSWINVTGYTKLALRSDREIAGIVPGAGVDEYVYIRSADYGTSPGPTLVVDYMYDLLNVTATEVSSGVHTIRVRADETFLELLVDTNNPLFNSGFEVGDPPTNWDVVGSGATWVRSSTQAKIGTYSGKLTRSGTNCEVHYSIPSYLDYASETVTAGGWVYATETSRARLRVLDGFGASFGSYHSGAPGWEWLTVTHTLVSSPAYLNVTGGIWFGDTSVYFDGLTLVEGSTVSETPPIPITTALNGEGVPDNSNDWYLDEGGAVPHMTSYSHVVNSTQVCWFEPTVMPSSSNLPDRSGNGNTGTMSFGNSAWVESTVGGITPTSAFVAFGGPAIGEPPEVLRPPLDLVLHEDSGGTGVGLPLYGSMEKAADSLGWSVPVLYTILILIICIVIGFAGFVAAGSLLGFAIGFGMTAAAAGGVQDATGAHIFPWWIALVCVMMALMAGYTWRHT